MNQLLCDPNRLTSFTRGELSVEDELELARHLDECETCAHALEQQTADASIWQEASALLGDRSVSDCDVDVVPTRTDELQIEQILAELAPTDDPDSLGRIGGYEVTGVVGSGGMGVVLKARDQSLDRVVAVKVMAPHLAASGSARQRFAREAKAAAAVLHPNVIAIHGVSNEQKLPYLVMPYVAGQSLQKRIDSEGPLPLVDVLRIGAQVAAGLAAAHDQGLVHRDIKPGNILMEQGVERVAITDFGLARAVDDASMTRSGVIAGTPQYMSPEQARGEPIDSRSDLFSLGSLLYAMCTGHSPFRAETSFGVLHRITHDQPRSIRETNPDIPVWLDTLVMRLLERKPEDRLQSAGEVADLLEGCLSHIQHPEGSPLPESVCRGLLRNPTLPGRWIGGAIHDNDIPISRRWLAAGFGFFAFLAGVVFVLESGKATLRVETTGDVKVKVRVVQDNETVDTLTVTKSGAQTRLRAGKYELQIDGDVDSYVIDKGTVTLDRGEESIVKVSLKPQVGEYDYYGYVDIDEMARRYDSQRVEEALSDYDDQILREMWKEDDVDVLKRRTVGVLFRGPRGLQVFDDPSIATLGAFRSLPHRTSFGFDREVLLAFENRGHRFGGTLRIVPPNKQTTAFLSHNSLPLELTADDIEQVTAGNIVRKIVLLTGPGPLNGHVETIASHRISPGTDLLAKAKERGTVLADLQLSRRLLENDRAVADGPVGINTYVFDQSAYEKYKHFGRSLQDEIQPPSDEEILRALEKQKKFGGNELRDLYETHSDNFRFVKERISASVAAPKEFPLVGPAQEVTSKWKCIVYFTETTQSMWPIPHTLTSDDVTESVTITQRQLVLKDGRRIDYPETKTVPPGIPTEGTFEDSLEQPASDNPILEYYDDVQESKDAPSVQFPTGIQLVLPRDYRLASRSGEPHPKMTLNGNQREFSIVGLTDSEPVCGIVVEAALSSREDAARFQKRPVKLRIESSDIQQLRTVQYLREDDGKIKRLLLNDPDRMSEAEKSKRIASVRFVD